MFNTWLNWKFWLRDKPDGLSWESVVMSLSLLVCIFIRLISDKPFRRLIIFLLFSNEPPLNTIPWHLSLIEISLAKPECLTAAWAKHLLCLTVASHLVIESFRCIVRALLHHISSLKLRNKPEEFDCLRFQLCCAGDEPASVVCTMLYQWLTGGRY